MKTTAICTLALAGIFAIGLGGGADVPTSPPIATWCLESASRKQRSARRRPHPNPAQGPGKQTPCVPRAYQRCTPRKRFAISDAMSRPHRIEVKRLLDVD